jgi:hypothetical protein
VPSSAPRRLTLTPSVLLFLTLSQISGGLPIWDASAAAYAASTSCNRSAQRCELRRIYKISAQALSEWSSVYWITCFLLYASAIILFSSCDIAFMSAPYRVRNRIIAQSHLRTNAHLTISYPLFPRSFRVGTLPLVGTLSR